MTLGAGESVEERSKPIFGGFHFQEIFPTHPEEFKLARCDARQRPTRIGLLFAGKMKRQKTQNDNDCFFHTAYLLDDDQAAHQIVSSAACSRTFKWEFAFLASDESNPQFAFSLLRYGGVNACSRYAKAMISVFARNHKLDDRSLLQLDPRWTEREPFGGNRDNFVWLGRLLLRRQSETHYREKKHSKKHQNHHPKPRFKPFKGRMAEPALRLKT